MKQKFPFLQMLRAENERRDRDIREPVVRLLDQCQGRARALAETLRNLEQMVGSEIGKHVIEIVGHQLGQEVRKIVYDALMRAGSKPGKNITITLSGETLRFMDPASLERQLLDRYTREAIPRINLRATRHPSDCITVLDVRVPEFGIRQAVVDR